MRKRFRLAATSLTVSAVLTLAACGPTSIFDIDEFGEIRYDLDLSGIPAEDSDPFRIEWQHVEFENITGGEPFNPIDPPEFNPRTLDQIPVGQVRVWLAQLPFNCSVEDAQTTVTVRKNQSTPVTFTVDCS